MASIGKLLSTKIGDFIIGVIQKRIGFKIEPYFFAPAGVDAVPLPNDKMLIDKKDGTGVHVIIGSLMISKGAKEGELILYSRDSAGSVKSKAYLNQSGEIVLNDGSDYAVAHTDLNIALATFTTALNVALASKLDGAGSSPGLSIDISGAKVDKVRL